MHVFTKRNALVGWIVTRNARKRLERRLNAIARGSRPRHRRKLVLGAGIVAKAIFPGGERLGLILTTLLGIGGALLGGLVASLVGLGDPIDEFFDFSTWAAAIVGALAILWVASKLGVGGRSRLA